MDTPTLCLQQEQIIPPNDQPCTYYLVEHKRKRKIASIRIRPSTARMLNNTSYMRQNTYEYVKDVCNVFRWDD